MGLESGKLKHKLFLIEMKNLQSTHYNNISMQNSDDLLSYYDKENPSVLILSWIIIVTFSFFLFFPRCKVREENKLSIDFSVALCTTVGMVQLSQIPGEGGETKVNLNCSPVSSDLGGTAALVFFTDGRISIFPIQNGRIDFENEIPLLSIKSFATENGEKIGEYESAGRNLIMFDKLNREKADITFSTFIDRGAGILKLLSDSISQGIGGNLEKNKNFIFLSTHLGVKNLSNVIFPVFDIINLILIRNMKIRDMSAELFPFTLTKTKTKAKIKISLPALTEINDILPPLLTVFPELNYVLFEDIIAQQNFYEFEITDGKTRVPIFISQLDETLPVIVKSDEDNEEQEGKSLTFFSEIDDFINKLLGEEKFLAKISRYSFSEKDLVSRIKFNFPEGQTQNVDVELYSLKGRGSYILASSGIVSPTTPYLDISIPQNIISESAYVKISKKEERSIGDSTIKEIIVYEKYKISDVPKVMYDVNFIPEELTFFDLVIPESRTGQPISIVWKIPERIKIDDLGDIGVPFPECIEQDRRFTYVNKNCFSHHIALFGEDEKSENVLVWRIFGLYEKDRVKLPNFTSPELIYDIMEKNPQIRIKKAQLFFSVFSSDTILVLRKTLVFPD